MQTLQDVAQPERNRILAAMSLSSLDRIARGQPIDLVSVDFTGARIVQMPGESFVGYTSRGHE